MLPFLGGEAEKLYRRFNLNEDWDSEHNRALIPLMPATYLLPNSKHLTQDGLSNFCVPTGDNTMWPPDRLVKFTDLADGKAETICILEVRDEHAQIWTQPESFTVDPAALKAKLGGHLPDKFMMSTADGAIRFESSDMGANEFAAMLTRDAGD